jgi:hypothetical protein
MTLNGKEVITYDEITGMVPRREKVTAKPSDDELEENYIYMVPIEGTDKY